MLEVFDLRLQLSDLGRYKLRFTIILISSVHCVVARLGIVDRSSRDQNGRRSFWIHQSPGSWPVLHSLLPLYGNRNLFDNCLIHWMSRSRCREPLFTSFCKSEIRFKRVSLITILIIIISVHSSERSLHRHGSDRLHPRLENCRRRKSKKPNFFQAPLFPCFLAAKRIDRPDFGSHFDLQREWRFETIPRSYSIPSMSKRFQTTVVTLKLSCSQLECCGARDRLDYQKMEIPDPQSCSNERTNNINIRVISNYISWSKRLHHDDEVPSPNRVCQTLLLDDWELNVRKLRLFPIPSRARQVIKLTSSVREATWMGVAIRKRPKLLVNERINERRLVKHATRSEESRIDAFLDNFWKT